jgi:hypothetical protein
VALILAAPMLLVIGATALLAIPSLHGAARRASSVNALWLFGAIALEVASCVSLVVIFRRFFAGLPPREARRLARIEMGSGALLPGGGIGSLAAGGVLLRRDGMSTRSIVEKSRGLFFLTSGTNVLAVEGGALLMALGLGGGQSGLLLTLVPALLGLAAVALVLAVPRTKWHRGGRSRALRPVADGVRHAEHELIRPHWRLFGALGYLGFDIAVLGLTCAGVGHPIGPPVGPHHWLCRHTLPVPGGIGVLEGGLVGALVLYGAPVMPATAAVLLYHTISFWIPSVGGGIAYTLVTLARRAGSGAAGGREPCEGRRRTPTALRPAQVRETLADASLVEPA